MFRHASSALGRAVTEALWVMRPTTHNRASRFRNNILGIPERIGRHLHMRRVPVMIGRLPCTWYIPKNAPRDKVILYLHGGAYIGGRDTLSFEAAVTARGMGMRVLAVDYRLAPENPYPAALNDALAAYDWLFSQGIRSRNITILGDSAGGGLAMALVTLLRDKKLALPASVVLFSPWLDLRNDSPTFGSFTRDPILEKTALDESAVYYASTAVKSDRYISPLFAGAEGLPPVFIAAGTRETLLGDSVSFGKRLNEAGVDHELHIWNDMFHDFVISGMFLSESRQAFKLASGFVYARAKEKK